MSGLLCGKKNAEQEEVRRKAEYDKARSDRVRIQASVVKRTIEEGKDGFLLGVENVHGGELEKEVLADLDARGFGIKVNYVSAGVRTRFYSCRLYRSLSATTSPSH